ncbi:MAG TPA: hypothetical protein VE911_06135 [Candidatus Nitrosopolaris sp.]|nr:hypothetical protein [Candidatus Nitrosopolaris sp.]
MGFLLLLAVPSTIHAQPSNDIESYALFAVDSMRTHGLVVTDGNVGVNSASGELFSAFPIIAPTSELSANTVRIPLSDCKNLFGNDVVLHSCGQRAPFRSPFNGAGGVEQACDYPVPFPDCDSAGTLGGDVTVGPQEVRRLEPNRYRTVTISRGVQPGRVILSGGNYYFCNLRMGRNADLLFDSAAQVFVAGELELGGMSFTGTGGNDVGAKRIRIIHRGRTLGAESTITIPPRSKVFGQLCAPRSMLRVRYASQLFGNFIARVIKTDRITARSFPPCVSTCGNGIIECKEVCDGDVPCSSSAGGAFTSDSSPGGAFIRCLDNCTRTDDSECHATSTTTITTTTTSTTGTVGTTTTTVITPVCGNGIREAGEQCDPPGSLTCPPINPGGANLACQAGCVCPRQEIRCCVRSSSVGGAFGDQIVCEDLKPIECQDAGGVNKGPGTCDTPPDPCTGAVCGNGIIEPGEVCDGDVPCGSSASGAFTSSSAGGAFIRCLDHCTRTDDSECHPAPREICGNCIDDNANGLTDFEDPACCAQVQKFEMVVSKGKIKVVGATSRLRLKSLLARTGLSNVNPLQEDVFVQLRAEGATSDLLCAQVPASHFMKRRHRFRFWDRKQTVASAKGLQDVTIKVAPDGSVKFRTHGKHVQLTNVKQGNLELTVGFHSATAGDSQNRCSQTVQPFRTGSTGALLAP